MTETKRPFPEVTAGLPTKSAKIRALAQAGYLRTEIAELLNIRYQHVRKVLEDAGIEGGLKRDMELERAPVSIEADEAHTQRTSWEVLLRSGFHFLGEWISGEDGIWLDTKAPTGSGVYAFIVDDVVTYVGLTQRALRTRLADYQRGHQRQKTSARIKSRIADTLAQGKRVKVLIATPEQSEWNGLPVNTAAGLEAGLIAMIRPEWNIQGAA